MEKARFYDDDTMLVEACIKRDLAAWSAFVKKYSPLISISIALRLKKYGIEVRRQDIEDIKQDVLTSIWRDETLRGVRNRADISYWLAVVSGNAAMMHARKARSRGAEEPASIFDASGGGELADALASDAPLPPQELSGRDALKKIEGAIEALPTKEALVAKLNILYNKKYGEIARILNMPAGTVSSYLKRAKEKLKIQLKDL